MPKNWFRAIAAPLTALGLVVGGASASAETLADTLASAYLNSGLIEQNRAVLRSADEDVAQALAGLRPVLSWIASATYNDPPQQGDFTRGTASLNADWLLFDFGRSRLGVEAAKESVLATRQALVDIENTVLLNAVSAYLSVRRSTAFVSLRENNVRLLSEQLRATRDRFDVGEVTRTDVSLAEARLAAARSGLAAENGGLTRARELFRAAVGRYPAALESPSLPRLPTSEAVARDIAQRENPAIRQVQHQVRAAELAVERASRGYAPLFSANAGIAVDDEGNDSASVGLQLRGDIYRGGTISSLQRQAQAQRDQARAQLYTTSLQVDQGVGNAFANLAVARASITASQQEVEAASLALRGVREELTLGARTTLDVLDQEQELLDARTNLVSAEVDRILAAYEILDAIGQLTVERLGLDVPIYDPAAYYNAVENAPLRSPSAQGDRLDRLLQSIGRQ